MSERKQYKRLNLGLIEFSDFQEINNQGHKINHKNYSADK